MGLAIVFRFLFQILIFGISASPAERHYVVHCTIFDRASQVLRQFEGRRCVFFPDGRVAVGGRDFLRFYSPSMHLLWEQPLKTHHQMNLNIAGDRLLVMASTLHKEKQRQVRYDKLYLFDLEGHEKTAFDFFDQKQEIERKMKANGLGKTELWWIAPKYRSIPNIEWEFSHANSFYEIPENDIEKNDPRFKRGHFLVSTNALGILMVLDSSLKKIVWLGRQIADAKNPRAHDTQMLRTGHVLAYSNVSPLGAFASIEEFDLSTGKSTTRYKGDPPESFVPPHGGGIQILSNGNFLISDNTRGGEAFEYDPNTKKKIWAFKNPEIDQRTGHPASIQQIKEMDLSEFLKRNKGF